MADLTIVASLLRDTNKKLDKLAADNEKSNSVTSIIAQSLPEILSDQQIAGRQERFDKKEGVTEVDEAVEKNTNKIVATLEETAVKTAKQAAAAAEKEKKAKEEARKVTAVVSVGELRRGKSLNKIEKASATFFKQTDKLEEMGADLKAQKRITEDSKSWTQQNAKVNIAGLKLRKENNRGDMTRAQKRKINDEIREERKKTGGLFRTMANALTGIFGFLKKPVKVVGALLATLGLAAALYGLAMLLESPFWPKITKFIFGRLIPGLKEFFDYFDIGWSEVLSALGAIVLLYPVFKILSIATRLGSVIGFIFSLIGSLTGSLMAAAGFKVGKGATTGTIKTAGGRTNSIVKGADGKFRYAAGSEGSTTNKAGKTVQIRGGRFVSAADLKNAKGIGIGSRGGGFMKTLSKFPRLKGLVKAIPFLGTAIGGYEAFQILNSDAPNFGKGGKAELLGRLLAGLVGAAGMSAIGASVGAAAGLGFLGVGAAAGAIGGGILGAFGGYFLGEQLFNWALGGEIDQKALKDAKPKPKDSSAARAKKTILNVNPPGDRRSADAPRPRRIRLPDVSLSDRKAFQQFRQKFPSNPIARANKPREFLDQREFELNDDFGSPTLLDATSPEIPRTLDEHTSLLPAMMARADSEKLLAATQELIDVQKQALLEQVARTGSSSIVSAQDNRVTNVSFHPRNLLSPHIHRGGETGIA
jgi:hypothetical protein